MKTIQLIVDNVPGIVRLAAVPLAAYNRIVKNYSNGISSVSVSSNNDVIIIDAINNDHFKYEEKQSSNDVGSVFDVTISGVIQRQNTDIETLESGKWIVVFVDSNGDCRCCGTKNVPMQFYTNRKTDGLNGNDFMFSCQQEIPTTIVDRNIVVE